MQNALASVSPLSALRRSCVGLAAALVLLAGPSAQAARVLAAAEPLRCSTNGVCAFASEERSLYGAYQQDGEELQFEALYRPYQATPQEESYAHLYAPWCVRITDPRGEVYTSRYGNPTCLALWYPNYREGISEDEVARHTERVRAAKSLVYNAQGSARVASPPQDRTAAWVEVQSLLAEFADTVSYLQP